MELKSYYDLVGTSPLCNDGKPSERTIRGVEETLKNYVGSVDLISKMNGNNPNKYRVQDVYLVGSGVSNRIDSDLDLVLVVPKISESDASRLKVDLARKLFCNRKKEEALDVFVGNVDKNKPVINLTPYVADLLKEYNPVSNKRH